MSTAPVVQSRWRVTQGGPRASGLAALAIAILLAPKAALATNIPFGTQQILSATALGAYAVHAVDVDGDGDLDLLASSFDDNTIAWYENDGASPPAWTERDISTTAMGAFWVHGADVDGDGDMDALSASFLDDKVAWYENSGASPPSWTERIISVAADGARSVFAADVDDDGDVDVLSASINDNKVAWYENNGASPPAWTPRTISAAGQAARSVFAADVDGDGDIDALAAFSNDDRIAWYENSGGSPPAWTARTISTNANGAQTVIAADVDRDGDMDVLSASINDNKVAWYENGGFTPPSWTERVITTSAAGAWGVHVADMDEDGDMDVLSASAFDATIAWHENDGAYPPSWNPRTISTAALGARTAIAADVDGDGDGDVLSASPDDNKVAWYENRTIHRSAAFPAQRVITGSADIPWSVAAADVDGDGDVDALSASEADDTIAWYENLDGAGGFGPQQVITSAADQAVSVFAADVDGDGDTDALSASVNDDTIAWYENDGATPPAWTARDVSTTVDGAWSVVAADVNADGNLDVLSASLYDHTISWHENNGASPPGWTEHVISTSTINAMSVFAADLDGDGDTDVLSAAWATARIAWHENLDGAGTFGPEQLITSSADRPRKVLAADVDGDGDMDVLSASQMDDKVAWYENLDGAGTFGPQEIISSTADGASSVFAADVDGDGDTDVLSASQASNTIAWYENDGAPSPGWTDRTIFNANDGPMSVLAADVDADGDLDVLSAWTGGGTIAWYPNRGGQFTLPTSDVAPQVLAPGATDAVLKIVATHLGRPGDTDLELATLVLVFDLYTVGLPGMRSRNLTSAEANALVEDLFVYRDDGDGVFGPGDFAVATLGTLTLAQGKLTVTFVDGDGNLRVAQGTPRAYFVVVHIAPGAASQIPNDFRITHVTGPGSKAEDPSADIPLSIEFAANVLSGVLGFPPHVIGVVPQNNTLGVPVGTNVTVIFSEPVDPATVTPGTFRLLDPAGAPVPASVGLAPDGRTATLDPSPAGGALAFGAAYTVEVTGGVLDPAGMAAVPFSSRFATVPSPVGGTLLPTVSNQSVLPAPPPGPAPGSLSSTAALSGSTVGPNLGFSVAAAGDLNNDSLADFLGGAPGYAPGGMTEAGAAAIYLGSNAPEPSSGNHPREVADVIFTGQALHDRAGTSVAAGFDFDGDGIGDILIGAEQVDRTVDPPQMTGAGKVYLIFFKPLEYDFDQSGLPDYLERSEVSVSLAQVGAGISGVIFTGAASGDQAGYAVAAGAGLEASHAGHEIVIGAPGAGNDDGKVYVVFSVSDMSGVKSLAGVGTGVAGAVFQGSAAERLGSSVALPGDVTDPEGPDIAMGAPLADTTQAQTTHSDAGVVYVAAAGDLAAGTTSATAIVTKVSGDQPCEQLGFAVASGGDNRASGIPELPAGDMDLLIGAPYHDVFATPGGPCPDPPPPHEGRVVQTTGRLSGEIWASQVGNTIEGVIWRGVQEGEGLGWSVARLGDLSGNNLDDIGLAAPFASPGMSGAGAVYVVEGSANTGLLGAVNADQVGQVVSGGIFLGTQIDEAAGLALCAAGDLDGDAASGSPTAADFTVGSPGWDASLGTVHQVLGTLLQHPGECTALGCTVADLVTGAVLVVPPSALTQGTKFRFQVQGLASLSPSCGAHALSGKSVVGWSDNIRTDCGTPPCQPPGFALRPGIEVPTRKELEYQLVQEEPLALRYCDATFGWTAVPGGPATGLVQDNTFVAGRKAVAAAGVDTLRRYGVFFDDLDHDDARDTCDCSPGDATRWSTPGPAGTLLFSVQTPTSATLTWGPPACMGGGPGVLLYDTIRSTSPSNFVTGAVCVEANGADQTAVDSADPPAGQVFYYIVSPENGCPSGPACSDPACAQPPARDC